MTQMSFYRSYLVSSPKFCCCCLLLSLFLWGFTFFSKVPLLLFSLVFWSEIDPVFSLPSLPQYECMHFQVIFSFLISTKSHEVSWVQKYLLCTEEVMRHKIPWSAEKESLKLKLFDVHFFVNYNVPWIWFSLWTSNTVCQSHPDLWQINISSIFNTKIVLISVLFDDSPIFMCRLYFY